MMKLDIVVPVKNEKKTLGELFRRINAAMTKSGIGYRLIVVDDHSTDGTVSQVKQLSKKYPIRLLRKKGKPGKAFSIVEGAGQASSEYVAMIDADLQYPPEAIPKMVKLIGDHGVVIANRKTYHSSWFRKFSSRANALLVGRLLLGLPYDIQSGLKLFRRDIIKHLDLSVVGPWSLDVPLLHTTVDLGLSIGTFDIDYTRRKDGESKINFLRTAAEIITGALKVRLRPRRVYHLPPKDTNSMLEAGLIHRRRKFVTHSTLPHHQSALITLKFWQRAFILSVVLAAATGFFLNAHLTAVVLVAILSAIYFLDVLFNLFLILKSLHRDPQISYSPADLEAIPDDSLPVYSILCPLYREARVIPQFLDGLRSLDWPKGKLDVQLLLEEDDTETIDATRGIELPAYVRMTIVPHSQPKTKPKACNYGLAHARGEYVVVYDAEDIPDPDQLKKAYLAFQHLPQNVFCLQAKLNYYNPHHNLLTKLFTAEYSLWFDVILPGLQSIETSIPLGGTSNHFRRKDLVALHGWDPFNVTEDCDLGVRLFKLGYRTAIIDSTTMEEANSNVWNWLRQRSRWIKGYMQTYLVHMRQPIEFAKTRGIHALLFQLTIGGKLAFMLINPILWLATFSYFALYSLVGPTIESLYPTPVFYMAVTSLVFGNFLCLYYYMIGTAKRGHWSVVKYIFLVPFYWLMVSAGAGIAFIQLLVKPHYWEKTHHGLHIAAFERQERARQAKAKAIESARIRWQQLRELATTGVASGGLLIAASMVANVFNFLTNAYLGRRLDLADFGLINLFGNLLFLSQIAFGSLAATVTHRSAYLFGKYGTPAVSFWLSVRKKALKITAVASLAWLLGSPLLSLFFRSDSVSPFLIFTPVLLVGALSATDTGFLSGTLKFHVLALLTVVTAVTRFVFSVFFAETGTSSLVYLAIPLALIVSYALTRFLVKRVVTARPVPADASTVRFPRRFFLSSVLSSLSDIGFLSVDVILAKHFLSPRQAGQYALISLSGKMIYFAGTLFSRFLNPMVSRAEGAQRSSKVMFYKLLAATGMSAAAMYVFIGVFAPLTVPVLFGPQAVGIIRFLPLYGLAMLLFSLSSTIVSFYQARGQHLLVATGFAFALLQVVGLELFHGDITAIVSVVFLSSAGYLVSTVSLHLAYPFVIDAINNTKDLLGLFAAVPPGRSEPMAEKKQILVMNWRDTQHVWAGGAEVYIHELAKRWVKRGYAVTLFCGNDGHHPRNETIDGVRVIRRGGFFTVYIWAILYYLFKFRSSADIIIDSENGIPFFTPLYAWGKRIFLLIHHVHQDVFRRGLKPPFSWIAGFLELRLMPLLYRHTQIVTVSPSSKADILNLRLSGKEPEIIYNGVDRAAYQPGKKSATPLVLYVGRLKFYKSIDVLLRAAEQILKQLPAVQFVIAGDGEEKQSLMNLAAKLGIDRSVRFLGRVSEKQKVRLYQKAWAFVNPSFIEGWGITTIEANACGTPVVASNVAGLRDSIYNPHSGMLVPYGNAPEFSKAITQLLTNTRMRSRMSREAIEWASRFAWEASADKMLKLIQGQKTVSQGSR